MQDVSRKPKKPKISRRLLALGILGAIIVASGLYLLWNKPSPISYVPQAQHRQVLLVSTQSDQLRAFTAWPTRAEAYSIRQLDGALFPPAQPEFMMDPHLQEVILGTLAHIETADDFGPLELLPEESLEDFGLGRSAFQLQAEYEDGTDIRLSIGNRIHGELPLDYLMVEGSDHLYAISADVRDTFDRPLTHLHHVPPVRFNPELLDRLAISNVHPFTLRRLEHNLWQMELPFPYPADALQVQKLLKQIASMRLAAYVGPADDSNLERFGFTPPSAVAAFHLKESTITSLDDKGQVVSTQDVPPHTITLSFGDPVAGAGWYVLYNDTIYQASDLSLGFLMRMDWHALASSQPIDIPLSAVHELRVTQGIRSQAFDIALTEQVLPNNELMRDEVGDPLFDFLISQEGQELPALRVTQPYSKLMDIRGMGRLPAGFVPEGEAILTLAIVAQNYTRQVTFYPYDGLHAAMGVDGMFLHFIDQSLLDDIIF